MTEIYHQQLNQQSACYVQTFICALVVSVSRAPSSALPAADAAGAAADLLLAEVSLNETAASNGDTI